GRFVIHEDSRMKKASGGRKPPGQLPKRLGLPRLTGGLTPPARPEGELLRREEARLRLDLLEAVLRQREDVARQLVALGEVARRGRVEAADRQRHRVLLAVDRQPQLER